MRLLVLYEALLIGSMSIGLIFWGGYRTQAVGELGMLFVAAGIAGVSWVFRRLIDRRAKEDERRRRIQVQAFKPRLLQAADARGIESGPVELQEIEGGPELLEAWDSLRKEGAIVLADGVWVTPDARERSLDSSEPPLQLEEFLTGLQLLPSRSQRLLPAVDEDAEAPAT